MNLRDIADRHARVLHDTKADYSTRYYAARALVNLPHAYASSHIQELLRGADRDVRYLLASMISRRGVRWSPNETEQHIQALSELLSDKDRNIR
ncbi:MAG TPA: hypothetical protein VJ183_11215 [Chloroflexia bacterium]|nr:hypothetical protein [Chloroflexia bacterium]